MVKRTEITIETRRVMVIGRRQILIRAWCEGCLAEVEMITPNEAARLAGVSTRTIYRWIEEERLHFVEEHGAPPIICAESLNTTQRKAAAGL